MSNSQDSTKVPNIKVFEEFSLINLMKHVFSQYAVDKMFGEQGQRKEVAIGIGSTIAKLAFASSNKSSIVESYTVEDYKLPSGSGLLELANVADIWLFEGAIGITNSKVLKKDIKRSFFNAWVSLSSDEGAPIWDETICFTPQRLITELNSIYKLNGQSSPAYLNVKKEELTLSDVSILDGKRISDDDSMRSKVLSSFFGYSYPEISQFGVPSIGESDRVLASWLFSTSGQQSETVKEG